MNEQTEIGQHFGTLLFVAMEEEIDQTRDTSWQQSGKLIAVCTMK